MDNKKCFRYSKHRYKKNEKCGNPKYKGYYEMPKKFDTPTTSTSQDKGKAPATRIHSTEEKEAEYCKRMEFIAAALKQFDKKKSKEPAVETARIEEVIDEKDFLQGL